MALPQCTALLNPAYFANIITQIKAAQTPTQLQSLINTVYGDLSMLESIMFSQTALLARIEALLTAPESNIGAIITWINTYITNVLTPLYAPYLTMIAQITALNAQVIELNAIISAVASEKFPGITFNIPGVSVVCQL